MQKSATRPNGRSHTTEKSDKKKEKSGKEKKESKEKKERKEKKEKKAKSGKETNEDAEAGPSGRSKEKGPKTKKKSVTVVESPTEKHALAKITVRRSTLTLATHLRAHMLAHRHKS